MTQAAEIVIPEGFESISCPGCDAGDSTTVYRGKDWILPGGAALTIVRCNCCGLAYLNPRPAGERLMRYYPADYHAHQKSRSELERGGPLATFARKLILRRAYARPDLKPAWWGGGLLARLLTCFKRPASIGYAIPYFGGGRLLDFGCGGGTFLRRMQVLGWDVTGVDFSEAAIQGVQQSGVRAYVGTLPHPQLAPRSFDLITMRHSLEHVPDPRVVLASALDLLVPGGVIAIQAPNFGSWEIEHYRDAAHTLDLPRHLLHFEAATLEAMLAKCGFAAIEIHQECRANWLQKSARLHDRYTPDAADKIIARSSGKAKTLAHQLQAEGRGNELFATAKRPQ